MRNTLKNSLPAVIRKKTVPGFFSTAIVIIMLPLFVHASAEKPLWVTSTGEAYQGETETPKEVMDRARRDAQMKAIEQATGIFLKSHTVVHNSQIADDLIYAAVRGKIKEMKILNADWDKQDRNLYRIRMRALVEPHYPEKGEGLSVKLHISKAKLREGEEVKIHYEANSDCYIYLFSIAADGSVTLLFPNSRDRENKAAGGKIYEFPAPEGPIRLKAMFLPNFQGKYANERIKLIATKKKEDLLPLGFQEGMFQAYDANSTGLVSDLVKKLNQIEPGDWTESTTDYAIMR